MGRNLIGRDWLKRIKLNWAQLCAESMPIPLQKVLNHHQTVFCDEFGELKGTQASIMIDSNHIQLSGVMALGNTHNF